MALVISAGLRPVTSMVIAAIGYWGVGVPLGVTLAFRFGMQGAGIWIGLSAGLAVVAVLLFWRWLRRDRLVQLRPALDHRKTAGQAGR